MAGQLYQFIAEHVPTILDGWYLGQEGGTALPNVIWDYNPGGNSPSACRVGGAVAGLLLPEASAKRGYLAAPRAAVFHLAGG